MNATLESDRISLILMDFEYLYKNTFKAVFRFFYYKGADKFSAEDLSQEVYLRFYKNFKDENDIVTSKKILYGICINVYKEWIRLRIKNNSISYDDSIDYDTYTGDVEDYENESFDDNYKNKKEAILNALGKLNPIIRKVIECRFLQGLSRAETAESLGITQETVHTYQKRGIKYLKRIIDAG